MLKNRKPSIRNEKGSAVIEVIPIVIVIVLFLNFSIGFFGAIHSGILNSIASRNYAFETFRHRANLNYFRSDKNVSVDTAQLFYTKYGLRFHGIKSEKSSSGNDWIATGRKIDFLDFAKRAVDIEGSAGDHNTNVRSLDENQRNDRVGVNPIWIKSQYGICLNSACGV
ncbi:MAG: hypothetical protein ACKOX6_13345 [Bdellovibrio sp.]